MALSRDMEGSSGRGSVEVCTTVQRACLHWRQLQTEALCAHKLESWERLRPEWWWRSRAFPHNLPQGTRTNRVLLPAFLMIVFWRIDFVKCTMILCLPLAILNHQMLVMMPESQ